MHILVTGGTGTLGRAVVPVLIGAGHEVRVMTHRPAAAAPVGGGAIAAADLSTGHGLAEAVRGVDAVVHLASAPYQGRRTVEVDVEGTRRLLAAARASGVRHLLDVSIVGVDRVPWG